MLDSLNKYEHTGHFFFKPNDSLIQVCNAPSNKSGIYIIYALKNGRPELVYIGCSGKIDKEGLMFVRKAGLGGLKDRLVNSKRFGELRRSFWVTQMINEKIEALDIYWYVTHNEKYLDCPISVESNLLNTYQLIYDRKPLWNLK